MSGTAWIFFAGLILFESVADIFAKEYSRGRSLWFAVVSIALFVVANTSWLIALRYGCKLSVGVLLFGIVQGLTGVFIGVVLYQESLTSLQRLGLVCGLVAIGLLSWPGKT